MYESFLWLISPNSLVLVVGDKSIWCFLYRLLLSGTATAGGRVSQRAAKRTRGFPHQKQEKRCLSNPRGHCWVFLVPLNLFQAFTVPSSCQGPLRTSILPEYILFFSILYKRQASLFSDGPGFYQLSCSNLLILDSVNIHSTSQQVRFDTRSFYWEWDEAWSHRHSAFWSASGAKQLTQPGKVCIALEGTPFWDQTINFSLGVKETFTGNKPMAKFWYQTQKSCQHTFYPSFYALYVSPTNSVFFVCFSNANPFFFIWWGESSVNSPFSESHHKNDLSNHQYNSRLLS